MKRIFADIGNLLRSETRKKVTRNDENSNIIFTANCNPCGLNVKEILKEHFHLIENQQQLNTLFFKQEKKLEDLLLRANPYKIKQDIMDTVELQYINCKKKT